MICQLDPRNISEPVLVANFSHTEDLFGITELGNDIFYLASANYTLTSPYSMSYSAIIWEVNMRNFSHHLEGTFINPSTVLNLTIMPPEFLTPNGLTSVSSFPSSPHHLPIILISDSFVGAIWSLNTLSLHTEMISNHSTMSPPRAKNGTILDFGI